MNKFIAKWRVVKVNSCPRCKFLSEIDQWQRGLLKLSRDSAHNQHVGHTIKDSLMVQLVSCPCPLTPKQKQNASVGFILHNLHEQWQKAKKKKKGGGDKMWHARAYWSTACFHKFNEKCTSSYKPLPNNHASCANHWVQDCLMWLTFLHSCHKWDDHQELLQHNNHTNVLDLK